MKTASFWLFILILIFCPLAFGTVELWSQAIMELLVPIALLSCLLATYRKKNWRTVPGLLPLLCFLFFIIIQLIPLPVALLKILSPASYLVYQPIIELQQTPSYWPISINIKATVSEFCRYATYVCFYILTIQLTSSYSRLRKTLFIILILGAGISFLAIIQKFGSPDKIYWFRQTPINASPVGPWVNRNHFAGFMEMLVPFGFALFLYYRPKISYGMPFREKIVSIFTMPNANRHILFGFATFLMGASIIISLSRGGMISTTLSLLFFILLLNRYKQLSTGKVPILFCVISIFLMATWIGWDPVIERFNKITNSENMFFDGRFLIWQDTLPMLKDYLLFGAGFGTYIHLYPIYRTAMSPGTIVDHAHNDYLELFANGGIIGIILVLWFLGTILYQAIHKLNQRKDNYAKLLGLAAICSILAIAFHSVTDFNMHNGANGLYFFFICGLLISVTHTRKYSAQKSFLKTQKPPLLQLGIPVLCLGLAIIILNQGKAQAYQAYIEIKNIYLNTNMPIASIKALDNKMQFIVKKDPLSGDYPFALANIHTFLPEPNRAKDYYIKALTLNPTKSSFLSNAGFYWKRIDSPKGLALLKTAAKVDRNSAKTNRDIAVWLLQHGEKEEGLKHLRTALSLDNNRNQFNDYVAIALTNGMQLLDLEEILPKETRSYIQLASFLRKEGENVSASYYYKKSMKYLDKDNIHPWYFNTPFNFFWKQKNYIDAMIIARKGVDFFPDNVPILLMTGKIYNQQGITYKAKEYYQQALLIEPDNIKAQRELARLQ